MGGRQFEMLQILLQYGVLRGYEVNGFLLQTLDLKLIWHKGPWWNDEVEETFSVIFDLSYMQKHS